MSIKYLKTDIYDRNGLLLLSKGQELTEEIMKKLERRNIIKESDTVAFNDEIKNIQDKFYLLDNTIFNDASDILSDVLFDSKTSPWWMFVNALSNYVDWLYTRTEAPFCKTEK